MKFIFFPVPPQHNLSVKKENSVSLKKDDSSLWGDMNFDEIEV